MTLSPRERDLLLEHTLADPEYAERLRPAPGKTKLVAGYTLDEVEDLLGYIAAEANHTDNPTLQKELDALYARLAAIQEAYDDGGWQDTAL